MRVQRVFAFVDLCGFTAYTEQAGDAAAVSVVAHLRATLRGAAERRGVRVTKWLGDGAMVCGIDAPALARCVLETRDAVAAEAPLPLRAGIAAGEAILCEGDDYVGAAVNIASRLAGRARPDQVLAAASVASSLRELVTIRPCPALRVPGVRRPVDVHELLCRTAGPVPPRAPLVPAPATPQLVAESLLRCPSVGE